MTDMTTGVPETGLYSVDRPEGQTSGVERKQDSTTESRLTLSESPRMTSGDRQDGTLPWVEDMLAMVELPAQPPRDAWEQTVGMFDGDSLIEEILDSGKRLRDARRPR